RQVVLQCSREGRRAVLVTSREPLGVAISRWRRYRDEISKVVIGIPPLPALGTKLPRVVLDQADPILSVVPKLDHSSWVGRINVVQDGLVEATGLVIHEEQGVSMLVLDPGDPVHEWTLLNLFVDILLSARRPPGEGSSPFQDDALLPVRRHEVVEGWMADV